MKNETVRPMTNGQYKDILATLTQSIPEGISFNDARSIIGNKGPLVSDIRSTIKKYIPSALSARQLTEWSKLYHDHFGIELDTKTISIPAHQKGFDRLIVVAQGITIQQAYDVCNTLFPCRKSINKSLDEAVSSNDRNSLNNSYAIWTRDRIEADEELKNISANNLKSRNISTLTLLERILFELKYFLETRNHLDINNTTLCTGSRSSDGSVPYACWARSKFHVGVSWCGPGRSDSGLRAREAVS